MNFVEITSLFTEGGVEEKGIEVATYERGVEDETFSCGTGVTAAAIAYHIKTKGANEVPIKTKGGQLSVRFKENKEKAVFEAPYGFNPSKVRVGGKPQGGADQAEANCPKS